MHKPRLALHRWSMGQVLMPAHFLAQEGALLDHIGLRMRLQGLPWYGVARLAWDDALLGQGAVSVSGLTVAFASGELLDVPGNAVISNLNLSEAGDAGTAEVFLHVLAETRDAVDLERYRDDDREVSRVIHRIELSTLPWLESARQSMKLAELRRDADGLWQLGPYVPPLLQVGAGVTPFLLDVMASREQSLAHLETRIAAHAADAFLGGERRAELRRAQAAVYRLRAFLSDHARQIALHPYFLFCALRDFFVEVCLFQNLDLPGQPARYDHDDLAATFAGIQSAIDEALRVTPVASPRLAFVRQEQRFVAGPFPDALARAREVYLLVQPRGAGEVGLDGVKLASPSRVELVHVNALPGVPFRRVTTPGFTHTFGSRAGFYLLEHGEEWTHAVRERSLCFIARPHLAGIHAALFWRS